MRRPLTSFADSFRPATLSRRDLLRALAAGAVVIPTALSGQQAGRGAAPIDTTPLVPPFEPTGWKTVWLDHLSYQCVDYRQAAAFYIALMGWKLRSDDGKQALLDIGENSGGILIRGGLAAPPPAAITDAGLGVTRPKVQAVFDGFAWGIEPWDTETVRAELLKRGLTPREDTGNRGSMETSPFKSFHVKDPDGWDLQISNQTKDKHEL